MKRIFTLESVKSFTRAFTHPGGDYPEFNYTPLIKWWQIWKYKTLFTDDYSLSRAAEILISNRMRDLLGQGIDTIKPLSEPTAHVYFTSQNEE